MVHILVMYPNAPGRKFNMDYYINNHMAMVHKLLDPVAEVRTEVDRGIAGAQPGAPAPFVAVGHLYFKNMEDMQKCMALGNDMMADIPNFTDAQPQIQICEVL